MNHERMSMFYRIGDGSWIIFQDGFSPLTARAKTDILQYLSKSFEPIL